MKLEPTESAWSQQTDALSFKQLRAFVAAAETGSFALAAKTTQQSPAAFSRGIKELEAVLGEALFVRLPHGVQLSAFGQTVLPQAKRALECVAGLRFVSTQWHGRRQPGLTLAGTHSILPIVMPEIIRLLRNDSEPNSLVAEEGDCAKVVASVLSGRAAFGLGNCDDVDPKLHCEHILESQLGLLIGKEFVLPAGIQSLDDLCAEWIVRLPEAAPVTQLLRKHGVAFDAYDNAALTCSSVSAALPLLHSSRLAVVASGIGATHPQAQGLRFIPLPGLLPKVRVSLISRKDDPCDARVRSFMQLVVDSVLAAPWHESVRRLVKG